MEIFREKGNVLRGIAILPVPGFLLRKSEKFKLNPILVFGAKKYQFHLSENFGEFSVQMVSGPGLFSRKNV